ncbi:Arabinanase/levansucrase/invertase [Penicillium digitatum]|uniref:Uncharacterized protein n=3 Tax=Penicillium digitatum TaxID=36651 RepID=K9GS46_PEND2|nr:hypothetical protein PDIP_02120 [Penicillium digitatum Pd1]EKV17448.1 hypothetical protein PDIG_14630 [Penicillium digitatum PHI26]EKV21897.1 hypothetical protein PDIP_02120 [Penicillium digitatum Pd1]KAG0154723.1 hypothetical protein PDIDSM_291 [Penicillium digitatum]QQK47720.1 Arabinanase/levansucrase/invertase [Penicillium digitatum]
MENDPPTPKSPHSISWLSERTLSVSTASTTTLADPFSPMSIASPSLTPLDSTESPLLIKYAKVPFRESPNFHPHFIPLLRHLSSHLWPLVNCETGLEHLDFPRNMLAYNLLTSEQVDNLARHFHQVYPPVPATFNYPTYITPWIGTSEETTIDLPTRIKRMGKFFGLRGCEEDVDMEMDAVAQGKAGENGNGENMSESEDELLRQMELEWQQALQRAYAEESHRWNLK